LTFFDLVPPGPVAVRASVYFCALLPVFSGITTVSLKLLDEQAAVTGRLLRGRLDESVQLDPLVTVAETVTVPLLLVTDGGEAAR
jgi:hypothetical protein